MICLAQHLLERGNLNVGLVTSWKKSDFPAEVVSRLAFFIRKPMVWPRLADTIWQSITMPKVSDQVDADVILNIDPIGTPTGGKARLFVTHDLYFKSLPDQYSLRERLFSDLIVRMMLRGNDAAICISENTLSELKQHYPQSEDKAYRVYSGPPRFPKAEHETLSNERHLLWVSNITANKNIACFYEALELLARRGLRLKSVVVGADPKGIEKGLRSRLKHAIPPRRLTNISAAELGRLYQESLCLVNTSLCEGFGLPILEAQGHGVPVICPAFGAPAEIGGRDATLTFEAHSPSDLAFQIMAIESDPQLRIRLIENGKANYRKFSWEKTAARVESLVLKTLESKSEIANTTTSGAI